MLFRPLPPFTQPSDGLPPAQELPKIAPPLPPLADRLATGGSSLVDLSGSASAGEGRPSTPGGGKSLAACMGFCEPATPMREPQ
jgi:hypothetical protein